jgi:hypothetical protein
MRSLNGRTTSHGDWSSGSTQKEEGQAEEHDGVHQPTETQRETFGHVD